MLIFQSEKNSIHFSFVGRVESGR